EHRHVERFAVVADEAGRSPYQSVHLVEQRALVLERAEEVLPDAEAVCFEERATDQEGIGPGAASEARRFQIDEEQRAGCGGVGWLAADQHQLRRLRECQTADVADANGAVPMVR